MNTGVESLASLTTCALLCSGDETSELSVNLTTLVENTARAEILVRKAFVIELIDNLTFSKTVAVTNARLRGNLSFCI
jgi:hypothetical protein